jgi:hypothetical protein
VPLASIFTPVTLTGGVFPAGFIDLPLNATTGNIGIPIAGDASPELLEGYKVTISLPGAGFITNAIGYGTITNEDSASTPSIFTVTAQPAANKVHQRDSLTGGTNNVGTGFVPVGLNITAAGAIHARCRAVFDGSIVQASYVAIANAAVQNGTVNIPGVAARTGQFYLDLSGDGGATWQQGTSPISMGDLIYISGQSLVGPLFYSNGGSTNAALGLTPANTYALITTSSGDTIAWRAADNAGAINSAFAAEFGRLASADRNCDIGFIGHSVGGSALQTWMAPDNNANYQKNVQVLAAAGNKWRDSWWFQGHTESKMFAPREAYQAGLDAWFAQTDGQNTFTGTKRRYVTGIPTAMLLSWGGPRQLNNIRRAQVEWCAANGATYIYGAEASSADGIHITNDGAFVMARHAHRAMKNSDVGPHLTSATRSGAVITCKFANAGTALVAGSNTQWHKLFKVFNAGTWLQQWTTASAVIVDATTVTLTLTTDPGVGQALDIFLEMPYDPSNDMTTTYLRDNVVDAGDGVTHGRAAIFNTVPVVAAAPSPGGATNAPPTGLLADPGYHDGNTNAALTYGAEVLAGFGQYLSGGTMQVVSSAYSLRVCTFETYFICPTLPASGNKAILHFEPFYVLVTSGGLIQGNTTSGQPSGTTVLTAGELYHVAVTAGAAGYQLYLKNITDQLAATREINVTTPYVPGYIKSGAFRLRCFNGTNLPMVNGGVFQAAIWEGIRYANLAAYAPPATPYVGTEANLAALWRCNGDVKDYRLARPT